MKGPGKKRIKKLETTIILNFISFLIQNLFKVIYYKSRLHNIIKPLVRFL